MLRGFVICIMYKLMQRKSDRFCFGVGYCLRSKEMGGQWVLFLMNKHVRHISAAVLSAWLWAWGMLRFVFLYVAAYSLACKSLIAGCC